MSDALNAGLAGRISRSLIMHTSDVTEARASFELFKMKPTAERMTRVTAKPRNGWRHDRRQPGGRAPTEIAIPDWFVRVASTNGLGIPARRPPDETAGR